MTNQFLSDPPKYLRSATAPAMTPDGSIDREGGKLGAGVIYGVSAITRGEALGHGFWIDQEFLAQVADAPEGKRGFKVRFTHPGLSSDGMGKQLGRIVNLRLKGDQVVGDVEFTRASHKTPDGNLADFVMTLAEDDPEAFATSIVFDFDPKAQAEFEKEHSYFDDETERMEFTTPDPENVGNYPHIRLAELRAVDVVDSPAANPGGLFHKGDEAAGEAAQIFDYAFGLSSEVPELVNFDMNPDRVREFITRHLAHQGLTIVKKDKLEMAKNTTTDELDEEVEEVEDVTLEELDGEFEEYEEEYEDYTGEDFIEAFGDIGARWFIEEKDFDECNALFIANLQEENAALSQALDAVNHQLASLDLGDEDLGDSADDEDDELSDGDAAVARGNVSKGVGQFVDSQTLPKS